MGTLTKVFEFDAAHRIMNEKVKCFNLHGHRFKVEVTLSYKNTDRIGYAIDFKEMNRLGGKFIDEFLDHSCILNPKDTELIDLCKLNGWKLYLMSEEYEYRNPSAENLSVDLFVIMTILLGNTSKGIRVEKIRLYETPTCWVEIKSVPKGYKLPDFDRVLTWKGKQGIVIYDDGK